MTARKDTTWNRDDRDLLVELRTEMGSVRTEIASARLEIKEINTGITGRLLHLEGNAATRIQHDQLEERVQNLEDTRIAYRASLKVWLLLGAVASSGVSIVATALLSSYFHL